MYSPCLAWNTWTLDSPRTRFRGAATSILRWASGIALSVVAGSGISSLGFAADFTWEVVPPSTAWDDDRCWVGPSFEWPGYNDAVDTATIDGDINANGVFPVLNLHLIKDHDLGALTVVNGGSVDLATYTMYVRNDLGASGQVTISGSDSVVDIESGFLKTDYLAIESGGDLEIGGGRLQVDDDVTISDGGRILGYGVVELGDTAAGITNEGTIASRGQTLTIQRRPASAADFDWDGDDASGAQLIVYANSGLVIDIPIQSTTVADAFNGTINVYQIGELQVNDTWALGGGTIGTHDQAVMNLIGSKAWGAATVSGGPFALHRSDTEINVTSPVASTGFAVIDSDMTVHDGRVTVFRDAELHLNGATSFSDGSQLRLELRSHLVVGGHTTITGGSFDWDGPHEASTTIGRGGTLTIDVINVDTDPIQLPPNQFDGTIHNSGVLDVSLEPLPGDPDPDRWRMYGVLNMTGGIVQSADHDIMVVNGEIHANAGVNEMNQAVEFHSNALVTVAPAAVLDLASVTYRGGTYTGEGLLRSGLATVEEATTIEVNNLDLDDGAWVLNADLTIDTHDIEPASSDGFDGSMGMNRATLDVNVSTGTFAMEGTLHLDSATITSTIDGNTMTVGDNAWIRANSGVTAFDLPVEYVDNTTRTTVVDGARLDLNDDVTFRGGIIEGEGTLRVEANAFVEGTTIISVANLDMDGYHSSAQWFINAPLTLQVDSIDPAGSLTGPSSVTVNNTVLTVSTPSMWRNRSSTITLNDGTLAGSPVLLETPSATICGRGSVTAQVFNDGQLVAEGGTLTMTGPGSDWDGPSNLGRLVANNGTLELRGALAFAFHGTVEASSTGEVFANGFALQFLPEATVYLTHGRFRSTHWTVFEGSMHIHAGGKSEVAAPRFDFVPGSTTELDDDLVLSSSLTRIYEGATFTGGGALVNLPDKRLVLDDHANLGVLVENQGRLAPGGSPGQVTVGDYQQDSSGILEIELAGVGLNDYDRLTVLGTAQLGGEVAVSLIGGFHPVLDASFVIVSAANLISAFDTHSLPPLDPGLRMVVEYDYAADTVRLFVAEALAADFDGDGDVDGDDFLVWQSSFGVDDGGDADGDGDTDGDDFLLWQSEFGSGLGSGLNVSPEPASLVMVLIALGFVILSPFGDGVDRTQRRCGGLCDGGSLR